MNLKTIAKKIIFFIFGKKKFQPLFESLNKLSLRGMNMGGGDNPSDSGEGFALEYVRACLANRRDVILFDVGANIGDYATLLREIFHDKAKIFAFEPSFRTFQKLSSNIGSEINVKLYNFGFGDKNSRVNLYSNADESGLASVYQRKLKHFNIDMSRREQVELKTIDSFCENEHINHINLLKLDVEGHEKMALDGAMRMIKNGNIDFIQFEFGGCNIDSRTFFQDFYYLLSDKYQIYRIVKDGLWPIKEYKSIYEVFTTTNYLAEKK